MFRGGEAAAAKTMIFAMVTKTEGIEEVQYIHIKKENQKMKNITKSIILSVAVAALAALLLVGCQEGGLQRTIFSKGERNSHTCPN